MIVHQPLFAGWNDMKLQCPTSNQGTDIPRVIATAMAGISALNPPVIPTLVPDVQIHMRLLGCHRIPATMPPPKGFEATVPASDICRASHHLQPHVALVRRYPLREVMRACQNNPSSGIYPSASSGSSEVDEGEGRHERWLGFSHATP